MLPRRLRLPRSGFVGTATDVRVSSPHFSLMYRKNAKDSGFGVVIAKKVVRLATIRHLLKRRILAVILPWYGKNRAGIVSARSGASNLSFPLLKRELSELMERAFAE